MAFITNRKCALLTAIALPILSGCSTIFDAPAESDVLSDQVLNDLQAIAQAQSSESTQAASAPDLKQLEQEGLQRVPQADEHTPTNSNSAKVKLLSGTKSKQPGIYFEKISNPMSQLVVLAADTATIWWNDKPLHMPLGNASHVFLIPAGKQTLTIEYADAMTFKAEIDVARYERITLRVDAKPNTIRPKKQ